MATRNLKILTVLLLVPLIAAATDDDEGVRSCSPKELESHQREVQQYLYDHWNIPRRTRTFSCMAVIEQNFRGEVLDVSIEECPDDYVIQNSVEAAAYRASPLPIPANRGCFARTVRVRLTYRAQSGD